MVPSAAGASRPPAPDRGSRVPLPNLERGALPRGSAWGKKNPTILSTSPVRRRPGSLGVGRNGSPLAGRGAGVPEKGVGGLADFDAVP